MGINFAQTVELPPSFFFFPSIHKSSKPTHLSSNQSNQPSRCSDSVCWLSTGIALPNDAKLTVLIDEAQDNYKQAQQSDNQASIGHEVLSGGAAFFAMHEFEKHQRENGKLDVQRLALSSHVASHPAS